MNYNITATSAWVRCEALVVGNVALSLGSDTAWHAVGAGVTKDACVNDRRHVTDQNSVMRPRGASPDDFE